MQRQFVALALAAIILLVVISTGCSVRSAEPEDSFSCSMFGSVTSRALFMNTGTFATVGPALMVVPECVHTESGGYANMFMLAPLEKFETGAEIDFRLGQRANDVADVGINTDISLAYYLFKVGDANMFSTLNVKGRVSRPFDIGETSIEPYGVVDYQRSLTTERTSLAFATGLAVTTTMPHLLGTPYLRASAERWQYLRAPSMSEKPLYAATAEIGITIPNTALTVGPTVTITRGDVTGDTSEIRASVGLFALTQF